MQNDIIKMAQEAGIERIVGVYKDGTRMVEVPNPDLLERFATLVAAAERNAILKMSSEQWFKTQADFEASIRARSKQ